MMMDSQQMEFFSRVALEISEADKKHGEWQGYDLEKMMNIVADEVLELFGAAMDSDVHGPHGVLREGLQLAATIYKLHREINRREKEDKAGFDAGTVEIA